MNFGYDYFTESDLALIYIIPTSYIFAKRTVFTPVLEFPLRASKSKPLFDAFPLISIVDVESVCCTVTVNVDLKG